LCILNLKEYSSEKVFINCYYLEDENKSILSDFRKTISKIIKN